MQIEMNNLIGKEVWFTHKKKGIIHGIVEKVEQDYCKRWYCTVKGFWLSLDRLFPTEELLRERLTEYQYKTHNLTLDELARLTCGRVQFSVNWGSLYDHPLVKEYCL